MTLDEIATKSDIDALAAEIRAMRMELQSVRTTKEPEWMLVADAARRLKVSPATIRRRIASGEMQARGSGKTREVRIG